MSEHRELLERISELESRLAFSEDTINQLNETVAAQDKEITTLQLQLVHLSKKLEDLAYQVEQGNPISNAQERPPHY
ncbi:MAG: SlyX family protein [Cellvibrionaceae bacterium]|nr:SlyX family protein [Cellvibrionaceae bacterium]MCV6626337.1 SlyX family protein [Cellvibrionaceae bacterium]